MLRILILLVALGSGGFAAWLAMNTIAQPAKEPSAVVTKIVEEKAYTHEILVANDTLGHGVMLQRAHIRWQPWAGDNVPPVFISRSLRPDAAEVLEGSLVRSGFVAGEPIRQDRLAKPGSGFLAGMLPSGKRAIAVRVSAESTAGGFILPNDRVDVIHTSTGAGRAGGDGQISSRAILSNVRVLAVDQTASEGADGTAVVGRTATLEVDPEQVGIIAAAEASGSISLALRAATDQGEAAIVADEKRRHGVVRILGGGRSTTIDVPSSRLNGS